MCCEINFVQSISLTIVVNMQEWFLSPTKPQSPSFCVNIKRTNQVNSDTYLLEKSREIVITIREIKYYFCTIKLTQLQKCVMRLWCVICIYAASVNSNAGIGRSVYIDYNFLVTAYPDTPPHNHTTYCNLPTFYIIPINPPPQPARSNQTITRSISAQST